MIDRIIISNDRAVFIHNDRSPVTLTCDTGDMVSFLRWVLTPNVTLTHAEFSRAVSIENEDTQEIKL